MHRSGLLAVLLVLSALLFACTGEKGPVGPGGATGNANVVSFLFGTQTTTSGSITYQFPATRAFIDTCMYVGYYKMTAGATIWYPAPGVGPDAMFQTRTYVQYGNDTMQNYYVKLLTLAGANYTTSTTFYQLRLFLIPPSELKIMASRGLNLADYNQVAGYLNQPK